MKKNVRIIKFRAFIVACVLIVTMLFVGGCGNQYERALTLFEQEKWQEAMAEAEKTPKENGDLQYYIGLAYANGFGGVEKDRKIALSWYEKSAARNCVNGLLACAQYYATGDGGATKDVKKAFGFIEKAAGLGSMEAKCELGLGYLNGNGGEKNEEIGVRLVRESANAGYDHGMFVTGCFFKDGIQVKKDLVEAMKWFEAAAAKGSPRAMFELAYAYGLGDQSEYHLQRDLQRGVENLKKSAELKLPYAQRIYGVYLMSKNFMGIPVKDGKEVDPDDAKEGAKYIVAAAEQGDEKAMFIAGKIFWEGAKFYGVERDENKAVEFWKKASAKDENANKYYKAIEEKGLKYPMKHDDLIPIEKVESFCSIPLYSFGIGKVENVGYTIDNDGEEFIRWFDLKYPFRIYKTANLYYAPLTKALYRIDLVASAGGDEYDSFAEYIAIREAITKKYGVFPEANAPENYPATVDNIIVPSYRWSIGDFIVELKSEHNPIRPFSDINVSAYSKRISDAAKAERELWKKIFGKKYGGDVL